MTCELDLQLLNKNYLGGKVKIAWKTLSHVSRLHYRIIVHMVLDVFRNLN